MTPVTIEARGIRAGFDPEGGIMAPLVVLDGGREVAPLHRAPWADDPAPGLAVHLAKLAGDFFCAPFAGRSEGSDMHGWTANGTWEVTERGGGRLAARLRERVLGAIATKALAVADDHPWLYQVHAFEGGVGAVTVANHANVAMPHGGHVRASPKAFWETTTSPQESDPARGRSSLRYPARAGDPRRFPRADGGTADLLTYPWAERSEDFCMGVEAPNRTLGWTAVTRPVEGDLFLSLRDPRVTPMTMLWHSNRGRDYAPWSGRNVCLGVEEGAAASMLGLSAAEADPPALALGGRAEVRHAIGAIAWPSGEPVAEVAAEGPEVVVRGEGGAERRLPFRAGFLDGSAA